MMEFGRFALAMMGHFLASLLYVLQRLHIVDDAVVDTSSILEHREELRELWEKRMMADENQSSSSSVVTDTPTSKSITEKENEEKVVKSKCETEPIVEHKMSNGFVKPIENNNSVEDKNANHIQEEAIAVTEELATIRSIEADQENNNSADSLEEDNNDDYVEEKTYTSKFETALVMKHVTEVTSEIVVQTTAAEETHVVAEVTSEQSVSEENVTTTVEECDGKEEVTAGQEDKLSPPEEVHVSSTGDVVSASEAISSSEEVIHEETITSTTQSYVRHEEISEISTNQIIIPDVENATGEDDDGFVRVEECLPHADNTDEVHEIAEHPSEQANEAEKQSLPLITDHEEDFQPITTTPEPVPSDKPGSPEIEQFVKSGGLKRILPGVQKTEQPYNTCTTETKIAMEIREMREREEELRLMREQALLSPVVSPVPPPERSLSPAPPKETSSPTPSGPGYRVSSVFGHKGSVSPSPPVTVDDEKKLFKGFNKESAVEKEIRMARDREEELRKQKGLPPREDDSYVKPSQVKSSQVRVFGKMVGTNNSAVKQAATAKIQLEIEEQTQREMALRETGHIQTISQERTDAKVAKLKTPECTSPTLTNGDSHSMTNGNGNYINGRSSPDVAPYKRSTPSPTGTKAANIFSQNNGVPKSNISMHKFIASKGKEATFSAPRNGGSFLAKEESVTRAAVPPTMVKLKRTVSVESKIQQEILEMKQREEELKKLHMNKNNETSALELNGTENEMNQKNNLVDLENGTGINDEEISPRHNKLIAQWEQRIQKAES